MAEPIEFPHPLQFSDNMSVADAVASQIGTVASDCVHAYEGTLATRAGFSFFKPIGSGNGSRVRVRRAGNLPRLTA